MNTPKIEGPHGRAVVNEANPASETNPAPKEPNAIDKATPATRTAFAAEGMTLSPDGHSARPKGRN